jgi:DNA-binding transcriptional ArsR family regulator
VPPSVRSQTWSGARSAAAARSPGMVSGTPASLPLDAPGTGTAKLNHMVQLLLDRTFAALADPTRREILVRLTRGPASISELAEPFGITLTGLKKHVQVLEDARLVTTEKVGRTRHCRLGPERLENAMQWIQMYRQEWDRRLDGLAAYLEQKKEKGK